MDDQLVPNPRHARLKNLLAEAEDRAHEVRTAYRDALTAMRSQTVWTGPTAEKWADELEEQHRRLVRLAQRVVDAIEVELHRHPAMVTRSEADAARRELAGRI
ncbi:hypothetical protein [Thermostaphylospora chromogena]|uniref:WXG100 family type VII secretion target n=1 Tax=Thermostaphylospora chromogena TaxID=35622 RepID=A0A1H1I019_9ACTN|nr:hypothetical protein [Thermostaphylospora chromogena]SDR30698.1 hypothetical protein SAMN04489764_4987 [Thermostaphylospora chromogena]